MPVRVIVPVLGALLLCGLSTSLAAESDAEKINTLAQDYEHDLAKEYGAVEGRLQGWFDQQRAQEITDLTAQMNGVTGEARLFVAFHLLLMDPKNQSARSAFAEAKIEPPLDEAGKASGTFTLSAAVDTTLAQKVSSLEHPPFASVVKAVDVHSDLVSSYWEAQRKYLAQLRTGLLSYKDPNEQSQIYQMLAYYYPSERQVVQWYHAQGRQVPSERWFVDDVDQFLITHELMAHDLLRLKPKFGSQARQSVPGTWIVPTSTWVYTSVRSCRLEAVLSSSGDTLPSVLLCDDKGAGVELSAKGTHDFIVSVQPGHTVIGHGTTMADLSKSTPLEFEIRDKQVEVRVGGLPLISATLTHAYAFRRFAIEGHALTASVLNLRFISSQGPGAEIAVATWPEERKHELDKTLTLSFSDTPVEEALAVISRLSGVAIDLDDSGQLLKDLPVSLEAKDMRLESVLQSLERQTDLHATPAASGIVLHWKK